MKKKFDPMKIISYIEKNKLHDEYLKFINALFEKNKNLYNSLAMEYKLLLFAKYHNISPEIYECENMEAV